MKGSCLCGSVVYELAGPIIGINCCHCKKCQKASGTAFATSAAVSRNDFSIVEGASFLTAFTSSPGKNRNFCGRCGSPIYSEFRDNESVYIRLGTLDAEPEKLPEVHIHVAEKACWYEIKDDVPQLEKDEGLAF